MVVWTILVSIVILMMIYCHVETRMLKLSHYIAESSKIPDSLSGRRAVLLSDLHNTYFGKDNKRLFDMIEKAKPDFVLIAGDMINGTSSTGQFRYASEVLTKLGEMKIPVYYAFGNHECRLEGYFNNEGAYKQYSDICGKSSILLNNAAVCPDEDSGTSDPKYRYKIYGVVFSPSQFRPEAKYSLEKPVSDHIGEADKDCYNILIAHDPTYFKEYMEWGADLVVSGHIHGGIIRLPFIGGLISPRYCLFPKIDKGLYRNEDGRMMIVSGGIGWHALPFRFMNLPEIVAIDFLKAKDDKG
ncbi:MAG: metallophosphoesterase [Lachnospiraceae bacterium]|nr:metallophosphoesterase [Lachnospiraceae bacterium]